MAEFNLVSKHNSRRAQHRCLKSYGISAGPKNHRLNELDQQDCVLDFVNFFFKFVSQSLISFRPVHLGIPSSGCQGDTNVPQPGSRYEAPAVIGRRVGSTDPGQMWFS